jgi:hypothetical protein
MKMLQSKHLWVLTSFVLFVGYWASCTKKDQIINVDPATENTENTTDLVSLKTSAAPTIDGTIDAGWDKAAKLSIEPQVPDPGNGLFAGYIGQTYSATLRSMYDDQNIYFLLEVADATKSVNVAPWYFNPDLNVPGKTGWQKEPNSRSFDVNGNLLRDGFGEDKFAMLWNIDSSTSKFVAQTCYSSCHIFTPYMDYSKNPAVYTANASGNHYTNATNEKIDMWWGRLGYINKDASLQFADDNYQDYAGGPAVSNLTGGSLNGRHVDGIYVDSAKTTPWPYAPHYTSSPAQGEVNNSQNLKINGTGASVAVPLWINPAFTSDNFILSSETSGVAKKVVGVDSTGALTLSDGTIITPDADFQRSSAPNGATAKKSIPAYIAYPLLGGRADIICSAVYNGSGWVIEYSRKLKTGDTLKQDIDFSNLADQPFGLAYWDQSNYQHGIKPNLLLKFAK